MNLPHDLLSQSVGQLIIAAYRIRGATYLIVKDNGSAYWSNIVSTKYHSITEAGLIEQIRFLVDNIYIQVGNRTFRHTNENRLCPTSSKPLFIPLRMQIHERQDKQLAKCFSNTLRYIDDLLTLNNPTFEQETKNIYPPQLELTRTTVGFCT